MAFTINRYAYTRGRELYSLDVNDSFREDLTRQINEYMENKEDNIELLTEQEVKDIVNKTYGEENYTNEKITAYKSMKPWYFAKYEQYMIGEIASEIINEWLWDAFCDTLDTETDDWEDEIEDNASENK